MKKLSLLALLLILQSCASYIDKIHNQIDSAERQRALQARGSSPFDAYHTDAYGRRIDKRPINNPVTYTNQTPSEVDKIPRVKRNYRQDRRRHTADDLVDNGYGGSLWAGQDKDNYLFSENKSKTLGDIIIIGVLEDMRNEIANELKRVFPKPAEIKKPENKDSKEEDKKETDAAKPVEPSKTAGKDDKDEPKVYDKISSQVTEIISKDYMMIRGKKEILFRKNKHLVDVQALISKKDIINNDTITSDKILEQRITVLR